MIAVALLITVPSAAQPPRVLNWKDVRDVIVKEVVARTNNRDKIHKVAITSNSSVKIGAGATEWTLQLVASLEQQGYQVDPGNAKLELSSEGNPDLLKIRIDDLGPNKAKPVELTISVIPDQGRDGKALFCNCPALGNVKLTIEDQLELAQFLGAPLTYDSEKGPIIAPPMQGPDPKKFTASHDDVKVQVLAKNPNGGINALPLEVGIEELKFGALGSVTWYKCKGLNPDTVYVLKITNDKDYNIAIDVMLDGRSSTSMANGKFKNAKYIIKAKSAGMIHGWLAEPLAVPAPNQVIDWPITEFKVADVTPTRAKQLGISPEWLSKIEIRWYGAWPANAERPANIPFPQGAATLQGRIKFEKMQVEPINYDSKPLGSIVIGYGQNSK